MKTLGFDQLELRILLSCEDLMAQGEPCMCSAATVNVESAEGDDVVSVRIDPYTFPRTFCIAKSVEVDWGDGSEVKRQEDVLSNKEPDWTHQYMRVGNYQMRVRTDFFSPIESQELFQLDIFDIDITWVSNPDPPDPIFDPYDFNEDGKVNIQDARDIAIQPLGSEAIDVREFLREGFDIHPGDANVDGVFNSSDLVLMFQRGKYEKEFEDLGVPDREPISWTDGDFNGDGRFDSSDLVLALQVGMYRS